MTTKSTKQEGVAILALRAFGAPLATPLDSAGVPTVVVVDRGDELTVSDAWHAEHQESGAFVAVDDANYGEHKILIEHELAATRRAELESRLQAAHTADRRAEIRLQDRQAAAAEARTRQASTTSGRAA